MGTGRRGDLQCPVVRVVPHRYQLGEDAIIRLVELVCLFTLQIITSKGKLNPDTGFFCFAFRITELAGEVLLVVPLAPCFGYIRADGP